jgi:hypothetical protein
MELHLYLYIYLQQNIFLFRIRSAGRACSEGHPNFHQLVIGDAEHCNLAPRSTLTEGAQLVMVRVSGGPALPSVPDMV